MKVRKLLHTPDGLRSNSETVSGYGEVEEDREANGEELESHGSDDNASHRMAVLLEEIHGDSSASG